jgi:hypothetical protein
MLWPKLNKEQIMRKYPNFTIEFNQTRRTSRPDMSTFFDNRMETIYEDHQAIYSQAVMIAGPYVSDSESVDSTFEGQPAATAMIATVDRASGRLNLEIQKWQLQGALFHSPSRTVRYVGSCDTLDEAKNKLAEFALECRKADLSTAKSPSWIDGFHSYAKRVYDQNAQPAKEPIKPAFWPGLSAR